MAVLKPSQLRLEAEEALQKAAYHPKRLVLIHTAASLGVALLITVLNFILSRQIAGTGGLAGLGTRSLLETAQSVLEFISMVATPFWEIGLIFAVICWIKGTDAEPGSLLQGFRRIGQVLLLQLLRGLLFMSLGMGVLNFCIILFMATPLSGNMTQLMTPLIMDGMSPQQMEAMMNSAEFMAATGEALLPLMAIVFALFAAVALPFYYRLRFMEFSVMDGNGAMAAMVHSMRMTKKNCLQLVKLDLSFWWYYLLQLLCLVLCYGDLILPALQIQLPFTDDTAFFLFFLLGSACQCLLFWQCRGKVLATYGMAYRALWQKPPTAREQNLPFKTNG